MIEAADYDRCGWGTAWGCKQEIETNDVILVINAAEPEDDFDNGHRLFHTTCAPVQARSLAEARRRRVGVRA